MIILLKYILIALFCISTIKNACPGSTVTKSVCEQDTTCKWTQTVPGSCSGENAACTGPASSEACLAENVVCEWDGESSCSGDEGCSSQKSAEACAAANVACSWAEATGSCTAKTCADYSGQSACNAVATCQWDNGSCTT